MGAVQAAGTTRRVIPDKSVADVAGTPDPVLPVIDAVILPG
jgi:hypothetical protein